MRHGNQSPAGITGILLIAFLLMISCPMEPEGSPGAPENPVNPEVVGDYPEKGEMSAVTAGKMLSYSPCCESYDDWLIGPAGTDGKITWGTGDQNGSYIELWEGGAASRLAFSADIKVRKSLALEYSVWFVNGPILTVDVEDSSTIDGCRGLAAGAPGYKFYGDFFNSGGQNLVMFRVKGNFRISLFVPRGRTCPASPLNTPPNRRFDFRASLLISFPLKINTQNFLLLFP